MASETEGGDGMSYAAGDIIRQFMPVFVLIGFAIAIAAVGIKITGGD